MTAKFAVPDPPAYLLPEMTVSVEIEVARKAGALALPLDAVRDLASAPWVLAVRDGRARRVPVGVGVRGATRVEIVSGLAAGDRVIPADRRPGRRRRQGPGRRSGAGSGGVAMPFELIAAFRFLREGRFQTVLILSGVAVGAAVIVFLVALITGLQDDLIARTLGTQPHIVLRPPDDVARSVLRAGAGRDAWPRQVDKRAQRLRSIDGWQRALADAAGTPGVTAVSPMASGPAFAARGSAQKSVALLGIEPERYLKIVPVRPQDGRRALPGGRRGRGHRRGSREGPRRLGRRQGPPRGGRRGARRWSRSPGSSTSGCAT